MPFQIIRNDITKMKVDAIVNAANTDLLMGGGVCGAIFTAAGPSKLQSECNSLAPINTGEAVITKGYHLPAKHIIHTAGPIWNGGTSGEESLLINCYSNSLTLAKETHLNSIAFPIISSGIYGYPKLEAIRIATDTIAAFLEEHDNDMEVFLVVFDKKGFAISEDLHRDVQTFIDDNYVAQVEKKFSRHHNNMSFINSLNEMDEDGHIVQGFKVMEEPAEAEFTVTDSQRKLTDLEAQLEETFQERLLRYIKEKNIQHTDVYKRANIDRKLFSKIINPKGYKTSKNTIIALAISLKLSLDETNDLLATEGFILSHSNHFDLIIIYCLTKNIYDIFKINEILFSEIGKTLN